MWRFSGRHVFPVVRWKHERPEFRGGAVKLEGHGKSAFACLLGADDCRRLLYAGAWIHQQQALSRLRLGFHFEQAAVRVDHLCESVLAQESAVGHVEVKEHLQLERHALAPPPSVSLDSRQLLSFCPLGSIGRAAGITRPLPISAHHPRNRRCHSRNDESASNSERGSLQAIRSARDFLLARAESKPPTKACRGKVFRPPDQRPARVSF